MEPLLRLTFTLKITRCSKLKAILAFSQIRRLVLPQGTAVGTRALIKGNEMVTCHCINTFTHHKYWCCCTIIVPICIYLDTFYCRLSGGSTEPAGMLSTSLEKVSLSNNVSPSFYYCNKATRSIQLVGCSKEKTWLWKGRRRGCDRWVNGGKEHHELWYESDSELQNLISNEKDRVDRLAW